MSDPHKAKLEVVGTRVDILVVSHALRHDQVDYLGVPRGTPVKVVGEGALVTVKLCSCIVLIDSDDVLLVPLEGVARKIFVS